MGSRFLLSFLVTLSLTLATAGGVAWAVARFIVPTPRESFFTSAYEFDLAPGWWCELDGTEHLCHPPGSPPHAAIMVMATKERNAQDRLEVYEDYLRQPKSYKRADGTEGLSEISFVCRRTIGGKEWVAALHLGSELPNYRTYYLATITSNLGILVTLSVDKDNADAYLRRLTEMMASLHVYQRSGASGDAPVLTAASRSRCPQE